MRKSLQLAAIAALGALVCSCVQEKSSEVELADLGRVSFVLEEGTRSDVSAPVMNNRYRLGTDEQGITYMLTETVTELDGVGYEAATRGTPAYTENVTKVFGSSFNGVVYGTRSGATQMTQIAGDDTFDETYGLWRRDFGTNPWEMADPLTFFLRMPASPSGVSNLKYNSENGAYKAGVMEFDYVTPSTSNKAAQNQQDILFAIRELSQNQYKTESRSAKGGASVLFRHALTGVKFAIGNNASQNGIRTFIKKVEFTGLKNKGHAVFNPDNSEESTVDDIDVFSSKNSFTWTYEGANTTTKYSQTYAETDIQDFAKGDKVGAPDSFYAAGEDDNLNKDDASLTFWFIPQAMTDAVKVTVTFYLMDGTTKGEDMTLTLDLGTRVLAQETDINKTWSAGQLRTFTLSPTTVEVDITDIVESKTTKKNLVIRNTGNKPAYMRVVIVGNWVDANGKIVAPWKDTDGTWTGTGSSKWVKGTDGYWYFTDPVAAGASPVPALFETYKKPTTTPSGATGLVMDIAVQALDVAAGANYASAWSSVYADDDGGVPSPGGDGE